MSPFAPFFSDWLHHSLKLDQYHSSVHLTHFPSIDQALIDTELETTMQLAQDISSMVLGLRKKQNIRVRQPLQKIMVPVLDEAFKQRLDHIQDLILSEVNVKEVAFLEADNAVIVKGVKPNFKALGPKIGAHMKALSSKVATLSQSDIRSLELNGSLVLDLDNVQFELQLQDVEIQAQDIPGWLVSSYAGLTVALDITLTDDLKNEGLARELVNRLQNARKDQGLDVTDRILVSIDTDANTWNALEQYKTYICNEILADSLRLEQGLQNATLLDIEGINCTIKLEKNG
jgi:isoleucyl-tRNA synthetase